MSKIKFNGSNAVVELPTAQDVVTQANVGVLKNVVITSVQDQDLLAYNSTDGEWQNSVIIDGGTY